MSQFLKDMRRLSAVPPPRRAEPVPLETPVPSNAPGITEGPGSLKPPGRTKRPATLSGTIRPTRIAQDGHSLAEESIYKALWLEGVEAKDPSCREVRIGYLRLMKRTPLGKNAILRNLKSLEEKLSIETIAEENSATCTGKTYRVYSYNVILDRRKSAGLLWFVRSRAGVRLLRSPVPSKGTGASEQPGASESMAPVPSKGPIPVPSETPPLGSSLGKDKEVPSSHAQLIELLHTELGFVDDAAVGQIIRDCRQRAPDVTTEELLDMTKATIERKDNMRRMHNPIGHLIRQIPQCFEGEAFRQYRAGKERERDAMEAETARIAAEMEAILADPEREGEHEMALKLLTSTSLLNGV